MAVPVYEVKHSVTQGIRAVINNNLSEQLQGTIRDRDKTLRGLKTRDSGQTYVDGLVLSYNYFRPHGALDGKRPAESAGAVIPWQNWRDVAAMKGQPAEKIVEGTHDTARNESIAGQARPEDVHIVWH